MIYRRLGDSGLRVSVIGIGSWLTYGGAVDDGVAHDCLTRAYERGVNFFDTADAYERGEAELTLGRWLSGIPRSDLVVATKVFFPMGEGPNDRGLSRKHILEQCDASLRRLGLDYVDLYQCHRFDESVPLDETLRALDDLIAQGKVLYAGVSEWPAAEIERAAGIQKALGLRRLVSNQPQYSLLARGIEAEVIPVSRAHGLGQVVWSPLAGGVLTGKYRPGNAPPEGSRAADSASNMFMDKVLAPDILEAVARLEREVAAPLDLTIAQLSLAWILRQPDVASAIVGASRVAQVDENVAAADVQLDEETLGGIQEIMGPFGTRGQD